MMEAAGTSETLLKFYQTTQCYNPEDSHLISTSLWVAFVISDLLFEVDLSMVDLCTGYSEIL
jgi:hypothetical protein